MGLSSDISSKRGTETVLTGEEKDMHHEARLRQRLRALACFGWPR